MRRSVKAEVVASTFDETADNHVRLANIVLEKAKRMVECGHDVAILLDSITRMARAYNTVAPASGKVLWSHPWKTDHGINAADPIVFNNQVFLSSGYNFGGGLIDISGTPKEIWKNKEMRNHFNTCVLLDGHLYGFDEKSLKCLDWATGNVAWKEDSLGKGSLAVCNGALVIVSDKGELVIADAKPDGYHERSRTHVVPDKNVWTSPAIADGKIFVRNPKGDLVALVVK